TGRNLLRRERYGSKSGAAELIDGSRRRRIGYASAAGGLSRRPHALAGHQHLAKQGLAHLVRGYPCIGEGRLDRGGAQFMCRKRAQYTGKTPNRSPASCSDDDVGHPLTSVVMGRKIRLVALVPRVVFSLHMAQI